MATKIRPINLHTTVDTHIQGLIDSSFVQARQTAGTDSASTQAMIDSNFANMDTKLQMPDNTSITFGSDSDARIFHSGSTFHIRNDTGSMQIRSDDLRLVKQDTSEVYLRANANAEVKLYHNGNSKFETTDSGTNVTGNIISNIRSNPKGFSVTHTVDSSDNALLVGPINVDSGVTLTINGTLMVV